MDTKGMIERYKRIDGLRAFAAIGIVFMHVCSNTDYALDGFVMEKLIPSFTNLVFLFMIISGFSLCCGYCEKIKNGEITLEQFYKKRFAKVWPFFALLCLLDFVISPSLESLYEVLANLTLCFGLIPNHGIEVIGVGWFLGLAFVFYFLFPFFCYLLSDRKRAWCAFSVTILLNYLCVAYFDVGRTSIAYSAMFFMAGGMIYLYRDFLASVVNRSGIAVLVMIAAVAAIYFTVGPLEPLMLLLYGCMLVYALGEERRSINLLSNPVTKMLSNISMEIYLSHMVIFRIIERINTRFQITIPDAAEYVFIALATLIGTAVFSLVMQKIISWLRTYFTKIT